MINIRINRVRMGARLIIRIVQANARPVTVTTVETERLLLAAARTEQHVLSFPIVLQRFKVGPAYPVI